MTNKQKLMQTIEGCLNDFENGESTKEEILKIIWDELKKESFVSDFRPASELISTTNKEGTS